MKEKNRNKTTQTLDDVASPVESKNEFILPFFNNEFITIIM